MIKLKVIFVYSLLLVLGSVFFILFVRNLVPITILSNVETIEDSIRSSEQLKKNSALKVANDETINNMNIKNLNEAKKNLNQVKADVIGFITIENTGVRSVILNGTTQNNLSFGVTTYLKNQKLGESNYVLFGHKTLNSQLFGALDQANIGSEIKVFNGEKEFKYKVVAKKIISDTNFDVLKESNSPIITLIACDKYEETNKRLVVIGKYEEAKNTEKFSATVANYTVKNNRIEKIINYTKVFVYLFLSVICYFSCFWYLWRRNGYEENKKNI